MVRLRSAYVLRLSANPRELEFGSPPNVSSTIYRRASKTSRAKYAAAEVQATKYPRKSLTVTDRLPFWFHGESVRIWRLCCARTGEGAPYSLDARISYKANERDVWPVVTVFLSHTIQSEEPKLQSYTHSCSVYQSCVVAQQVATKEALGSLHLVACLVMQIVWTLSLEPWVSCRGWIGTK